MAAFIGFGVFMGAAIGFGYGAATPAAIKWFPLTKKGLITGLVIGGLGMASVYVAPLARWLIADFGISQAFLYLGIGFASVAIILAQFIRNPPAGYVPPSAPTKDDTVAKPIQKPHDVTPGVMLKEPVFYLLYVQFICATMAGLMIISQMAKIVTLQFDAGAGISAETIATTAVLSVSVLAIFNAAGRVVCGILSDLIGRSYTILLVSAMQCVVMIFFSSFSGIAAFYIGAAFVGFNYGACMPVFAATAGDLWGMKNFGKNYALLYTAWGLSGVVGPMLGAFVVDMSKTAENPDGTYALAYTIAAILCAVSVVLSLFIAKIVKARHARLAASS
jgi:MFS family permease